MDQKTIKSINVAAMDYANSHFHSPKTIEGHSVKADQLPSGISRAILNKPQNNVLKCCTCGTEQAFPDGANYEELAACPDDDCLGQCFCNKWDGWEDARGELVNSKIVSV